MNDRIEKLIEQTLQATLPWIKDVDGKLQFVDPIDGKEISAHYGATHIAASLVILGEKRHDDALLKKGIALTESILDRWEQSEELPAFHFDFNNFALCLIFDTLSDDYVSLKDRIRNTVSNTADSNHETINWLPMRIMANQHRYDWTKDEKFKANIAYCQEIITQATNADGGTEDRLPHGTSFNLQYDVATIAVDQYLNVHGCDKDLSKQLGFLLNVVAPDGDINYQGRGINQIFAWGMWIYLLASSGQDLELNRALNFIEDKVPVMLTNHNIMLNDYLGEEKYLWWDYHYCSVYTAHFLLWMILTQEDYGKKPISPVIPTTCDTGLHIIKNENYFVSWFEGRKEYLAEKGPMIAAIWMKKYGMITKGCFGPWLGAFGNQNTWLEPLLNNFCGLKVVEHNYDTHSNRYIRKMMPRLQFREYLKSAPLFTSVDVVISKDGLSITFENEGKANVDFCLPALQRRITFYVFTVSADGNNVQTICNSSFRNQYGWCNLFTSKIGNAKKWTIKF